MRLPHRHPRYASLKVRAGLAAALRKGLVVPEGLIAHGRGEAFDYLLGEATSPSARRAERQAARWLLAAEHPVLSVNGNVAALQAAVPHLKVEVNLFHRTPARARAVARTLVAAGVRSPLGVRPTARIPDLDSDRAAVDAEGIARADLCLIPLEDGDRAEALRALSKKVIAIDLNPLSRTSRVADLPIVDELSRALREIALEAQRLRSRGRRGRPATVRAGELLADAYATIERRLRRQAARARRLGAARRAD